MPVNLTPILMHIPAFMLVLFRLTGIFIFAPMFGSDVVPIRVRVLLALVLAFCVYPLVPVQTPVQLTVMTLPMAVGGELLIGLIIGYGASIPLIAMQVGGRLIAQQLGLSLAEIINPETSEQNDVIGQVLFFGALVIFLALNGHHAMLSTLVGSFQHVPLAGYVPDDHLMRLVVGLLTSMFELAIRVAAPLLCLIFLETVAMGFVARTVPHLNILSLGFPLRIIIGLLLLIFLMGAEFQAFGEMVRTSMNALMRLFTGM